MKRVAILALLAVCVVLSATCAPNEFRGVRHHWDITPCKTAGAGGSVSLSGTTYQSKSNAVCLAFLPPFDAYGWFESNLNSQPVRGKTHLILGCINCRENCTKDCGVGCTRAVFNFDFTKLPPDAEVYRALLAVYTTNRQELLTQSILRGRLNKGKDFVVLDDAPQCQGRWMLYDITDFACRASLQRRNSTTLEIELPCNECISGQPPQATIVIHDPANLEVGTGVDLAGSTEPRIIFEYR